MKRMQQFLLRHTLPLFLGLFGCFGFTSSSKTAYGRFAPRSKFEEVYEDHPKAIWVPVNESGILAAKAFFSLTRLRHVQVEVGFHTIERQAWRYCHSLTIVKPPSSVVAVEYAALRLLQLQCQAVCPWGPDFLQNVALSNK